MTGLASDTARLAATVDFPTPPLPDATAIMCFTPASRSSAQQVLGCRLRCIPGFFLHIDVKNRVFINLFANYGFTFGRIGLV